MKTEQVAEGVANALAGSTPAEREQSRQAWDKKADELETKIRETISRMERRFHERKGTGRFIERSQPENNG